MTDRLWDKVSCILNVLCKKYLHKNNKQLILNSSSENPHIYDEQTGNVTLCFVDYLSIYDIFPNKLHEKFCTFGVCCNILKHYRQGANIFKLERKNNTSLVFAPRGL